jgi:MFS family permease
VSDALTEVAPDRRRFGGLLWDSDFRLFWFGETTSQVGTQMAVVSTPLVAVVVLHASTLVVGLLLACAWAPWLVIGLPAGAWVDRLSKRRVMVLGDAASLVLFGSVPVAAWMGVLTIGQLVAVAVLAGCANVFSSTAYSPYLRTLVRSQFRMEANAKLEGSESVAAIGGPGLGGLVAGTFGAVYGLLANALSFAVSAWCLLRIRAVESPSEPRAGDGESLGARIGAGVRFMVRDPYLRVLTLYAGLGNFGEAMMDAVLIVFLVRTVHVAPVTAGLLMTGLGLGGVLGAFASMWISQALGSGRGLLVSQLIASPFLLLLACTTRGAGLTLFVLGGIVYAAGIVSGNIMIATFTQDYVPVGMQARRSATTKLVVFGTTPLGAVAGAFLGQAYGPRAAVWIAAIVATLSVGILFAGPLKNNRNLPTEQAVLPGAEG